MKQLLRLLPLFLAAQIVAADPMPNIQTIPLKDIDGKDTSLKDYSGKVVLLVNVASKCGNTPQYAGLEAMYAEVQGQGLSGDWHSV